MIAPDRFRAIKAAFGVFVSCAVLFVMNPAAAAGPISAVLPRPVIVPFGAQAEWDFKGFGGIGWTWCTNTPEGRVDWGAFDKGQEVRVVVSDQRCAGAPNHSGEPGNGAGLWSRRRELWVTTSEPLDYSGYDGAGRACPFSVPAERIALYRRIALQARTSTKNAAQQRALEPLIAELDRADGSRLTSGASGPNYCGIGPRWREAPSARR